MKYPFPWLAGPSRGPGTKDGSWLALWALLSACVGTYESAVRHDLGVVERERSATAAKQAEQPAPDTPSLRGDLPSYLRLALQNNSGLRASFEEWRASVYRISRARRLPEPTIGFGYFLRSIETRVGPQQARVSLQQAFPWPTRLSAGADAASARARAAQRRFEAEALSVKQRVASAYWDLWQIRTTKGIHEEHLGVLRGLSESVRARMTTGTATLASLQQIDLTAARLEDNIRGMGEAEHRAQAQLRASIGVTPPFAVPTLDEPLTTALPANSAAELQSWAKAHPSIESRGLLAEASEAAARAEGADRFPSFTLGVDWVITGEAASPASQDSGRDAVMVGAGLRLPLWQGSYSDSIEAAKADSRAHRAYQQSLVDRAQARLTSTLAELRDAGRRARLHRETLVPQAESAYESVLGSYTVGRGSVAQALLSQRDLLELRVELERARSDHARAWVRLEELVGRELRHSEQGSSEPTGKKASDERQP